MAIVSVSSWRIAPGRGPEFIATCAEAKKIQERLGARVRILQAGAGPRPLTLTYVVEVDDWTKFGEFNAKAESDTEWQALLQRVGNESPPAGELLESGLAQDLPLP